MKEWKRRFKSENKLEGYYSGDEDIDEKEDDEDDEEDEEDEEKDKEEDDNSEQYESVVEFEKLSKFNNNIKDSKDRLLKEYINVMKLYSKKSKFLQI